jgi:hypothetical protein
MGFDLYVQLVLNMCPNEGKPYYYSRDDFKKLYDISPIVVPTHLRKYVELRGHFLHAYTRHFNEQDRFVVEVCEFLEDFPSWEDVVADDSYSIYDWEEKDHTLFKELLEWCQAQNVFFNVNWSY